MTGHQSSFNGSTGDLAGKVERIAHMMRKLLADLPFCDPDIKDLEQAAAALRIIGVAQQPVGCGDPSCKDLNCTYGQEPSPAQGCDKGEAVAWRITDGEGGYNLFEEPPEEEDIAWAARHGRRYEPLHASPPPPAAGEPWTTASFWEYVGGLAGEFERDQMRETLAQRGLRLTSSHPSTQSEGGK